MKKNRLYDLTILMTIALVGIIWVQWYWINNGIKIKEQQFDQLVNTSLNDIIAKLEDKESVSFLSKKINSFTSDIVIETDSSSNGFIWSSNFNDSLDVVELGENSEDVTVKVQTISKNEDGKTQQIKTHKKVIVNNKVVTDDINVKTEEILGDRFDNVIVRMVKEFKRRENPLENFVGKVNLDSLITHQLYENGIDASFAYAIIENDSIISKYSSKDYELTSNNNYQIPLFKHDLSAKPTLFSVSFSNKRITALKSMWGMVLISVLFTLIILLCFSGALYYMFKQKKVAEIKNDFINNMTHEFKTPISTISLAIDSITHPKIIDDKKQINYYADIIRKENKRMNMQVESVLNTSLAEKNELTLDKKDVSIIEILDKVKTRMQLQLNNANASLTINNNSKIEAINIDENHFQNVLCNLIDNAIKYTNDSPKINLTISSLSHSITFVIEDNGIGMSKETQKKVFDKFYRVQSGNIHNIKGFGIGLSYVKAIVEAHHGEISVDSKLNKGTKITINLPVQ